MFLHYSNVLNLQALIVVGSTEFTVVKWRDRKVNLNDIDIVQ